MAAEIFLLREVTSFLPGGDVVRVALAEIYRLTTRNFQNRCQQPGRVVLFLELISSGW